MVLKRAPNSLRCINSGLTVFLSPPSKIDKMADEKKHLKMDERSNDKANSSHDDNRSPAVLIQANDLDVIDKQEHALDLAVQPPNGAPKAKHSASDQINLEIEKISLNEDQADPCQENLAPSLPHNELSSLIDDAFSEVFQEQNSFQKKLSEISQGSGRKAFIGDNFQINDSYIPTGATRGDNDEYDDLLDDLILASPPATVFCTRPSMTTVQTYVKERSSPSSINQRRDSLLDAQKEEEETSLVPFEVHMEVAGKSNGGQNVDKTGGKQKLSSYESAHLYLSEILPHFVTPLEQIMLELCIANLFVYVQEDASLSTVWQQRGKWAKPAYFTESASKNNEGENFCEKSVSGNQISMTLDAAIVELLWDEILERCRQRVFVSNHEDTGLSPNVTVHRLMDMANAYVPYIELLPMAHNTETLLYGEGVKETFESAAASGQQITRLKVTFTNTVEQVLPLTQCLSVLQYPSSNVGAQDLAPDCWHKLIASMPVTLAPVMTATEDHNIGATSASDAQESKMEEHMLSFSPLEFVHCLITLSCHRRLQASIFQRRRRHVLAKKLSQKGDASECSNNNSSPSRQSSYHPHYLDRATLQNYAVQQLPRHWFMSGRYTHSLYLLFHNLEYVAHRIVREIGLHSSRSDNVPKPDPLVLLNTMDLWTNSNITSVLANLLFELETWFDLYDSPEIRGNQNSTSKTAGDIRTSTFEASSADSVFMKVLGFWCHSFLLPPQVLDNYLSPYKEERALVPSQFKEQLKKCSLACERVGAFLGMLAESSERIQPAVRKETGLEYFLKSLEWRKQALWYVSTNLTTIHDRDFNSVRPTNQSPNLVMENLAKSPSDFDLLNIIAILPGQLNTTKLLDLVDAKGMHLVLPHTEIVVMFCRQTGKMLDTLAIHWYNVNDAEHSLACFTGAHELLWLSDPPLQRSEESDEDEKKKLGLNDSIDLDLTDGLAAPAYKLNEDESDSARAVSDESGCYDLRGKTGSRPVDVSLRMMPERDRWATLSSIELHRGMLNFSLDLKVALSCFQHSKDHLHRSARTILDEDSATLSWGSFNQKNRRKYIGDAQTRESRLQHFEKLSTIYSWIASTHRELGQIQLALEFFHESMEYTKRCVSEACDSNASGDNAESRMVPWVYKLHLANVLFNMAVTLDDLAMYKQSLSRYVEAYAILSVIWEEYCFPPSPTGGIAVNSQDSDHRRSKGIPSLLSDASQSMSATSASVMGDMLEIWLCIGNVHLRLQQSMEGKPKQEATEQKEALQCFIQGLKLFLDKWCLCQVPFADRNSFLTESKIDEGVNSTKSTSKLVVDTDGKWMHSVVDLMANISCHIQQTSESDEVDLSNSLLSVNTQKSHQYASVMSAMSSFVQQVQQEETVLQRVRRLIDFTNETLSAFESTSINNNETDKKSNLLNSTELGSCWQILADAEYEVNDVESALSHIEKSLGGRDPMQSGSCVVYRLALFHLRLHNFARAEHYFLSFLSALDADGGAGQTKSVYRRKGDAYFHLGYVQSQMGRYKCAISSYRTSLTLRTIDSADIRDDQEQSRDATLIANTYHEMSIVYLLECSMNHDELSSFSVTDSALEEDGFHAGLMADQAREYLEMSVDSFRETVFSQPDGKLCFGADAVTYAIAAKNLAVMHRLMHNWNKGIEWFQQARDMLDILPKCKQSSLETANICYEWGMLCSLKQTPAFIQKDSSSLDSAEVLMRQALHLYQQTEDGQLSNQVQLARIWFNLGRIKILKDGIRTKDSSSNSTPLEYLETALSIMGRVHPSLIQDLDELDEKPLWELLNMEFTAQLYHDIGTAYLSIASYEVAVECLETSEQLRKVLYEKGVSHAQDKISGKPRVGQDLEALLLDEEQTEALMRKESLSLCKTMHAAKLAKTLNNLGIAYSKVGKLEQSSECYDQALDFRRRRREMLWERYDDAVSGASTYFEVEEEFATTLFNAGHNYLKLQKRETALGCFESAIDIFESLVDTPGIAWTLANLYYSVGMTHSDLDHWSDAKEAFQKSLKLRKQKCQKNGKQREGKNLFTQVFAVDGDAYVNLNMKDEEQDFSIKVADANHHLGTALENLGDYQEAMICYEEAWFLRKLHLSRDHISMAQSLSAIANLKVIDGGQYDVALKYYQEALRVELLHSGPVSIDVAETYYRLGMIRHVTGEWMEARESYVAALRIYEANKMSRDSGAEDGSGMKDIIEAWKELQRDFEGDEALKESNLDWSKLSYNPRGCIGKMEEILKELLVLLDAYVVQPAADRINDGVARAASLVNDAIQFNQEQFQARLPPAPSTNPNRDHGKLNPSVNGMFDPQQQLCLYLD